MTKFSSEQELHDRLLDAINHNNLHGLITDNHNINDLIEAQEDFFPQFSIDHLSRKLAMKSAQTVLKSLYTLELLSSDRNISITYNEALRPDIVCINPEKETIVLFELKNSKHPGRQSLTELLAYEQELKNMLPFISNYDVQHVLISSEWSTLMDHAASSAIAWSGKNLLCLDAVPVGGGIEFSIRIPATWKITGSTDIPGESIPSVTLCLYSKNAYSVEEESTDEDELDRRILSAFEVMTREADRIGANGFAILWKDYLAESQTGYNITICGISPYDFFRLSRAHGRISDKKGGIVENLDRYVENYTPQGHSASLMHIATCAYPLLEEVCKPRIEGFHNWEIDQKILKWRAEPILCEFWGVLGDYSRQYVMHPSIRTHRRNVILDGRADWRNPAVAIPLIQSFSEAPIFPDGNVRCSDAYRLGSLFGENRRLKSFLSNHSNHLATKCAFEWNFFALMPVLDEIQLLGSAARNVKSPDLPFQIHMNPLKDDEDSFRNFMSWLCDEFFQNSELHRLFFHIGLNGMFVLERHQEGYSLSDLPTEFAQEVKGYFELSTQMVLDSLNRSYKEKSLTEKSETEYEHLCRMFGLRKNFSRNKTKAFEFEKLLEAWPSVLECSNSLFYPVLHEHAPMAEVELDWEWLKQGVLEMRERGMKDAGVILLANGQVVTGPTSPPDFNFALDVDVEKDEVAFLDQSNGVGVVRVVTWEALKGGLIFQPLVRNEQ